MQHKGTYPHWSCFVCFVEKKTVPNCYWNKQRGKGGKCRGLMQLWYIHNPNKKKTASPSLGIAGRPFDVSINRLPSQDRVCGRCWWRWVMKSAIAATLTHSPLDWWPVLSDGLVTLLLWFISWFTVSLPLVRVEELHLKWRMDVVFWSDANQTACVWKNGEQERILCTRIRNNQG